MNGTQEVAIEVKNVSKEYDIAHHKERFFALKDVSFTLCKGDVLGIVGSNGSGKSTLLKILSLITKPTTGEALFYGSVTSILDVGNNVHPDLTGRENVSMHLKLAGIARSDFESYYQKIQAFSEIGDYFDQPVKYYSSGMFLRLAFSLAFHLASDILILDEVLSVGDEGFRLKCQELLKAFTESGKTILFVSHNRLDILELSTKCIWLDKGAIRKIGSPTEVLGEYFAMHRDNFDVQKKVVELDHLHLPNGVTANDSVHLEWSKQEAPGNEVFAIRGLSVTSRVNDILYHSDPIEVKFLLEKKKTNIQVGAFFFLEDIFYQPVLVGHFLNNSANTHFGSELKDETGLIEINCTIPAHFLIPGKYYFLVRFGMEENEWTSNSSEAFRFSEKLSFQVHAKPGYQDYIGDMSKGAVRPRLDWEIKKVS
jgi:lipopolysaccharide transport system ATP-binding protein